MTYTAGIDIGSSTVKAVELHAHGSKYKLTGFGYAELPGEAIVQGSFMNAPDIARAIGEACGMLRSRTKSVATSVSGHSVIVKRISRASAGDIIVMHDADEGAPDVDQRQTVEATARLIPVLRARGFSFGKVCENQQPQT